MIIINKAIKLVAWVVLCLSIPVMIAIDHRLEFIRPIAVILYPIIKHAGLNFHQVAYLLTATSAGYLLFGLLWHRQAQENKELFGVVALKVVFFSFLGLMGPFFTWGIGVIIMTVVIFIILMALGDSHGQEVSRFGWSCCQYFQNGNANYLHWLYGGFVLGLVDSAVFVYKRLRRRRQ